ncbi:hypothetical protein ABZ816_06525 [Actinosynnema sp. NPDC047251]|uniref:Uncharacterized protein n=1 Tax=Saccharothrix espanaensis (strain ATCC 51144 / DSM 44229 / JCM 9112 / NBRC 15066 / NRRL 15764) TaxID=1179773 RepID=K0JNW4_SACES|nr:hypothetical protein [Saccharothrix espanaensis]CCH27890.1 hypothetical protein BN6_05590 [Saccharothrix espanaensis DSM 44229]
MSQQPITDTDSAPPRRDWVLRCDGSSGRVFEVGVTLGTAEVHLPLDTDCIRLELQQVRALRSALDEAITCVEADLRAAGHVTERVTGRTAAHPA